MKSVLQNIVNFIFRNDLKLNTIMANIKQLQEQVEELQVSLDKEQEQVQTLLDAQTQAIQSLEATIEELKAGNNEADLEALSQRLSEIKADLENTVVEDSPVEEPVNDVPTEEDIPVEEEQPTNTDEEQV